MDGIVDLSYLYMHLGYFILTWNEMLNYFFIFRKFLFHNLMRISTHILIDHTISYQKIF